MGSVPRRMKQRERGLDEATSIESFLVLNAGGGDGLEDFDPLRQDAGLGERLGHGIPRAGAARKFLDPLHEEERIEPAQRELAAEGVSYIPAESASARRFGASESGCGAPARNGAARSTRSPP